MKRIILGCFLVSFALLTFFSSFRRYNSSDLSIKTTKSANQIRNDFINDKGSITFAEDKGYATVIKTYIDGKVVLEEYFNEYENPVSLSAGYSKLKREYEDGLNTRITYLNKAGDRIIINDGYDSIHKTYTEDGLVDTDTYYIGTEQVKRVQGYWAYKRIYKNKKICEIRYLDQKGNLVCNRNGYAMIRRTYNNDCYTDFYFDENEEAVTASRGQYGVKVDGDTTTYLDADGQPINTTRGYAIIRKDSNKTLYYDKDGKPLNIGNGQYGIQKIKGQRFFLDKNGEILFRLDNFLYTHPVVVLTCGILLAGVAAVLKGKQRYVFIVVYVLFILYMTILNRATGDSRRQFQILHAYKSFLTNAVTRQNIINNIWLFIPLGAALSSSKYRNGWLFCIVFSICIEAIQFFGGIGLCDVDDVISNSLGGILGFLFASWIRGEDLNKQID